MLAEYQYCQYAEGFKSKRQVLKLNEIPNNESKKDTCTSYLIYTEDLYQYWRTNKKTAGYNGKSFCRYVPIDIDSDNLEEAQNITSDIIHSLEHNFEIDLNSLRIFFSGSKGFHLELPYNLFGIEPCQHLPQQLKSVFEELDFNVDKSIYQHNKLWRLPNTINSKSGLHKIQLNYHQFQNSINEIKHLAEKPKKIHETYDEYTKVNDTLHSLFKSTEYTQENFNKIRNPIQSPINISNGKIPQGVSQNNRNSTLVKLSVQWREQGLPISDALDIAMKWNLKCSPPESECNVINTVKHIYKNPLNQNFTESQSITWFLRRNEWVKSLNPKYYRVVCELLVTLNEISKTSYGIEVKPNQRHYSEIKLAEKCMVDRGIVRRCINKLVQLDYANNEKIVIDGKNQGFIFTWKLFKIKQ